MSQEKYYTLKAGFAEPQVVERGEINRSTGLPTAVTEKAFAVVGKIAIPNFSRIWGKRIRNEKGELTGEITPMAWGVDGGEVIEIRYMRNSNSLDMAFQKKGGLKLPDEDSHISLNYGLNDFDSRANPQLVRMLQLHTYNGDSICRDPQNKQIVYANYDEAKVAKKSFAGIEQKYDALQLVMSIKDNAKKLKVFGAIFGIDTKKQDKVILTDLLERVDNNPALFIEHINKYKNYMQALVLKANDFQLLNLNISGEVHLASDKNGAILSRMSSKIPPSKKVDYLVEYCMEPEVFDAINRIKGALEAKEKEIN